MTARHHHYLSQCYLKGFTSGGSKKSKLAVIDLSSRKHFETTPRNVGGIRDFNRVEIDGLDPNVLEKALSGFESAAASALCQVASGSPFEGETRGAILNLIAMIAVRSPDRREHWRQFHAQIAEQMMGLTLASKDRWESQTEQMKASGVTLNESITYEDVKEFFDSKEYTIEVAREYHIRTEFGLIETVLPLLDARQWLLIRRENDSSPLITSDNPVSLTWNEPETIPPFYRSSPGFGMKSTQVYFPLSKDVALLGEFDGREGEVNGTEALVALLNSKTLMSANAQVYAPSLNFVFYGAEGRAVGGRQLLKHIAA